MFYSFSSYTLIKKVRKEITTKKGEGIMRKKILLSILAIAFICSFVGVANASAYVYELTNNYAGTNVPLGATVVVTAKTNDPNSYKVVFTWLNPAHQFELIKVKDLQWDGSSYLDGKKVWVATSSCTVDVIGDWNVYAIFFDKFGNQCFSIIIPVKIRHISFNVIPEIPIIGTAGASIAMIAGFTFKMKRKSQK